MALRIRKSPNNKCTGLKELVSRKLYLAFILVGALITFYRLRPSNELLFSPNAVVEQQKKAVAQNQVKRSYPNALRDEGMPLKEEASAKTKDDITPATTGKKKPETTLEELIERIQREDYLIQQRLDQRNASSREYLAHGFEERKKKGRNPHIKVGDGSPQRKKKKFVPKSARSLERPDGTMNFTYKMAQELIAQYTNYTSQHCLTAECIDDIAKDLARAFPARTNKEEWCIPKGTNVPKESRKREGLLLVKVPKAASSTTGAVVLRLAHRHNCDLNHVFWDHQYASKNFAFRDPTKSFMLASSRNPAKQLISYVFWSRVTLSRPKSGLTEQFLVHQVTNFRSEYGRIRDHQGGLQLQFAALEKIPRYAAWNKTSHDLIRPQDTIARVKKIIEGYDFILVVERMDESLVALSLLMGVPVGDVLVSSSKVSAPTGGSTQEEDRLAYVYSERLNICLPMIPPTIPPLLQQYFDSDYFRGQAYGDLILNAAASRSLDLTIERTIGVERFQAALKEYRYWKQREKKECASRVEFPCSSEAVPQRDKSKINCYERDMGCGYQCIDEMLARGK